MQMRCIDTTGELKNSSDQTKTFQNEKGYSFQLYKCGNVFMILFLGQFL